MALDLPLLLDLCKALDAEKGFYLYIDKVCYLYTEKGIYVCADLPVLLELRRALDAEKGFCLFVYPCIYKRPWMQRKGSI